MHIQTHGPYPTYTYKRIHAGTHTHLHTHLIMHGHTGVHARLHARMNVPEMTVNLRVATTMTNDECAKINTRHASNVSLIIHCMQLYIKCHVT